MIPMPELEQLKRCVANAARHRLDISAEDSTRLLSLLDAEVRTNAAALADDAAKEYAAERFTNGALPGGIRDELELAYLEGVRAAKTVNNQRLAMLQAIIAGLGEPKYPDDQLVIADARQMLSSFEASTKSNLCGALKLALDELEPRRKACATLKAVTMTMQRWPSSAIKLLMDAPRLQVLVDPKDPDSDVTMIVSALDDEGQFPMQPPSVIITIRMVRGQADEWASALSSLNLSTQGAVVPDLFDAAEAYGNAPDGDPDPQTEPDLRRAELLLRLAHCARAYARAKRGD